MNVVGKLFTVPGLALVAASLAVPAVAGSRAAGHDGSQPVVTTTAEEATSQTQTAGDNPEGLRSTQSGSGMRVWWAQQFNNNGEQKPEYATKPATNAAPQS